MNIEEKVKANLLVRGFDKKTQLNNRGLIEATIDETILEVVKNLRIADVNGCVFPEILEKCKEIVTCDTARISKPLDDGKMFLIVGFNRSTKDNVGQWVDENGERRDFDYVEEYVIASGFTEKELINSTKEYVRLCGMTWEEYFADLREKEHCR